MFERKIVWTKRLTSQEVLRTNEGIGYVNPSLYEGTFIEKLDGSNSRISYSPLEVDIIRDDLYSGHIKGELSLWGPLSLSQRSDMTLEVSFD